MLEGKKHILCVLKWLYIY